MKRFGAIVTLSLLTVFFVGMEGWAQSTTDSFSFNQEEFELGDKIELYPNPTTDYINIQIKDSKLGQTQIVIYNIIGNELKLRREQIEENHFRFDVKELPSGYYLLSLKDPSVGLNRTYKFLKR